jgi:RND family efflux transporter MFP subunit
MKRKLWIGLGAVGVLLVGGVAIMATRPKDEIKWRQAKADKGNITQRINATGTINALISVPVGTQVSGVVTGLYADYNSLVKKGQVIARIDPTVWETQLKDAEASLQRSQATYDNAKAEYERNKRLAAQKLVADSDLEAKEMAMKTALGNLDSAKAGVVRAKINLGYCTITAPVDGVVVSRVVDVGQTVAASFSTPNLFTIAQDLSKMKVEASIDEADIGLVKAGQRAFFTVDSYPDRQFVGSVSEVRLEPIVNQNVVTYKVVMEITNEPRNPDAAPAGDRKGFHPQGDGKKGAPDFDALWERMKDRVPPGTTKEAFIKRAKERMAEGGGERRQAPSAAPAVADSPSTARYIQPGSAVYKGDLALLPGMTANVSIVTNRRQDVLRVPSVALRFNAAAFMKDDAAAPKAEANRQPGQNGGQRQGGQGGGLPAKGMVARREDRVWTLENGKPKAIIVKAGISDGQFTEILGDNLPEGTIVLTGVDDQKKAAAATASPIGGPPGPGGGRR